MSVINPKLNNIIDCLYRVSVKAVIVRENMILLVKDVRDKDWSLPGGGVDLGEKPITALKRELSEEIGVLQKDFTVNEEILGIVMGQVKEGTPRCNIHYSVLLKSNKISPTQEVGLIRWFKISDLNDQVFDSSAGPKNEILNLIHKISQQK